MFKIFSTESSQSENLCINSISHKLCALKLVFFPCLASVSLSIKRGEDSKDLMELL